MTKQNIDEPEILIDCDVIRHFIAANKLDDLPSIFPNKIVIIDVVKKEICRSKKLRRKVLNFLKKHKIKELKLEDNDEALFEYVKLIQTVGEGEAACMAMAKVSMKYVGSSNYKDIKTYCYKNGIKIISTMDFLYEALMSRKYTPEDCNNFINKVLDNESKLPCRTMDEFVEKYKMKKKKRK